jgi:hypothetical protein
MEDFRFTAELPNRVNSLSPIRKQKKIQENIKRERNLHKQ